jgi:hypothetical protein
MPGQFDPKSLLGSWRIGSEDRQEPNRDKFGVMTIQADGRIVISAGDRLGTDQSTQSISEQEAARHYRRAIVLAGTYAVSSDMPEMVIQVDEASDPYLIGKSLKIVMKPHLPGERIAMGPRVINNNANDIISKIWNDNNAMTGIWWKFASQRDRTVGGSGH